MDNSVAIVGGGGWVQGEEHVGVSGNGKNTIRKTMNYSRVEFTCTLRHYSSLEFHIMEFSQEVFYFLFNGDIISFRCAM